MGKVSSYFEQKLVDGEEHDFVQQMFATRQLSVWPLSSPPSHLRSLAPDTH